MSLRRNTLWNLVGTGLPLLVGVVTIPYLINEIGNESFGILTLIWALIGYFSIFDFGFGRALTQQVASAKAENNTDKLLGLIKTGKIFIAITGIGGGVLMAVLAQPLATSWLNISPALTNQTQIALYIASIGIPFVTVATGLRGVLEAFEEFKEINIIRVVIGLANFGLPALSVYYIDTSLVWMVLGLVIARVITLIFYWLLLNKKLKIYVGKANLTKEYLKKLMSFGAWMTVSNLVSPLMVTADRFIISAVLGASVVAYYTVPFELMIRVLIIPGALTSALFPRLSILIIQNKNEARKLYKKCLLLVLSAILPICLAATIFSHWGMKIWIDESFADNSWQIICILSIGILFNSMASIPYATIQAFGDARSTTFLHIIEFALYIPILFILLHYFGLIGAAIAWSTRTGFDLIALLYLSHRKGI